MKKACFIPLLIVLSFFACKEPQLVTDKQQALINPPVPALDPAFDTRSIDAEAGAILVYGTGSKVVIPPAALVDAQGNPLSGQVEIAFREFHNSVDVLLSGIPMAYDSAGQTQQFQTAGMFELRARQNGQEVFLGEGSMAQVKLASSETEDNYNFYRLDEEARGWQYEGQRSPELNETTLEISQRIAELKATPGKMKYLGRNPFAFNYDGLLDVFYNENENRIYENWGKAGTKLKVLNKARAYGLTCLDFTVYQRIEWKGQSMPACMMVWDHLNDKPFPEWAKQSYGHKLQRYDGDVYKLVMTAGEMRHFVTWVKPVMPLKQLFAFPPSGWVEQSEEIKAQIAAEEARMAQETAVMRNFEVREFGVYNWDRFLKEEDPIPVLANFNFGTELNQELTEPVVFYLPGDNRSVVKMPRQAWKQFAVVNDPNARMISILPGPRIALYSKQKYRAIDRDELRKEEKPDYTFVMEDIGALESQAQLMRILGM